MKRCRDRVEAAYSACLWSCVSRFTLSKEFCQKRIPLLSKPAPAATYCSSPAKRPREAGRRHDCRSLHGIRQVGVRLALAIFRWRVASIPRGLLAGPSRNPGSPSCAHATCRQRPQRSRDSRLGLDQLRRRSGRSPQPTTHIPTDLDRNRKGAPSPLATMLRRSTKLATRSPWRGAHRWWGRHLRGHRGSTRLQAGELRLVQLCGGIRRRLGAMGMEHLVSARHMVGVRMMVLWRSC